MRNIVFMARKLYVLIIFLQIINICIYSGNKTDSVLIHKIDTYINSLKEEGEIPGMAIIIIKDSTEYIKTFGYADLEKHLSVTPETQFELASCSKAFTALAILNLEADKKLNINDNVSKYLPWFFATYKNSPVNISIRHLLYHTSGIPWNSLSLITKDNNKDALLKTIKKISGIKLHNLPGKKYEYASVNYDVLGLIIEEITKTPYNEYLKNSILQPLSLTNTTVRPFGSNLANGYKIGFFKPRAFDAPLYGGNIPAAYIITTAGDISKWLKFQIGNDSSTLSGLIVKSHSRDETVSPHGISFYAMGWEYSLEGKNQFYHSGLNPNFSSYIIFRSSQKIGVAVLVNSNTDATRTIAHNIIKILSNEPIDKDVVSNNGDDKAYSVISIVMMMYVLAALVFLCYILYNILKNKRLFEKLTWEKIFKFLFVVIFIIPFLYGLYILPKALAGFSWDNALVWSPFSFGAAIFLFILSIVISLAIYFLALLFPEKNKFKKSAPKIILLSILTGISNMIIILLITSSLKSNIELKYILFYFILAMSVYILGRKYVQTSLIKLTRDLIYELRIELINKIFSTSYQKIEKIDRGRIYTTLNDDIGTIGSSTNLLINLVTSLITAFGILLYLSAVAFWATVFTFAVIAAISVLYFFISRNAKKLFEESRDTRNVFMRLLNGMIDGFKEISLHYNKKIEFKNDIAESANEYREKISKANIRFLNVQIIGDTLIIFALATVAFIIPVLFSDIKIYTIISLIIVLLYLMGPITSIFKAIPEIMQLRIAWARIQQFLKEIQSNLEAEKINLSVPKYLDCIKVENLEFKYKNGLDTENFSLGPISFEIKKGQSLFITGGNGSGKTTLAKLIVGLYSPDAGKIYINEKEAGKELSEYFTAIFNPVCLFNKLYGINVENDSSKVQSYLSKLNLLGKVKLVDNEFSTIDLSGGQRKRLALLQSFLEDNPIFLFDEWAADQDPGYKKVFYTEILPMLKQEGKIIIAITHDDNYFQYADKIIKLNYGQITC